MPERTMALSNFTAEDSINAGTLVSMNIDKQIFVVYVYTQTEMLI
jgi:hypothetical protein